MRTTSSTGDLVDELLAAVERLKSAFACAVARYDLSPPQAKALRHVAVAGPVPMRDLAARLGCDSSNVTGIVDRLEVRGLIERRTAADDRRVKTLVVTAEGARLAERMWAGVCAAVPLEGLTEGERRHLDALLRRIHGA